MVQCHRRISCPCWLLVPVMLLALLPLSASANELQDILIEATSLANAGDAEGARALYQQLIDDHNDTVYAGHAWLGMAKLHVKANENDEALAAFDHALEYPSTKLVSRAATEKVALLANRFQDYEECIAVAQQYLTELGELMPPYDRRLMIVQLAFCYDKSGQPEDAVAVYEQEILLTPALLFATIYYERLLEAPMPEVTEDQLNAMLLASGTDGRLVIGAYLYAGNYREAMIAAQDYMGEAPAADMVKALNQVARVFKAKDLNLVRGNRFLEYARTGEGENPLSAFWDEVTE